MKLLISKKTKINYYYKEETNQDFHCKEGFIKKEDIINNKTAKTNLNIEFDIHETNEYDQTKKYKRGAQIIRPKDLGYIASRTMTNKTFNILEAGGGSGAATIFLAGIANHLTTYEIKENHKTIIEKNLTQTNTTNVTLKLADLNEHIQNEPENHYDLLFLDLPEPHTIIQQNLSCLKKGKYIVCYLPSVTQIIELTKTIEEHKHLHLEEITEIINREWKVTSRIARPEHKKEIDHTAFLIFIRHI